MRPETFAALAVLAVLSASVQSAVGFGQNLVLVPGLLLVVEPAAAVVAALLLATLANVLVLGAERRARAVDGRRVALLATTAIPGMVAGAAVLSTVEPRPLQAGVGVLILAAAGLRLARPAGRPRPSRPADALAGLTAGALGTATSLSGPPLALRLSGGTTHRAEAHAARDTLTATLLALNVGSAAVLAAAQTGGWGQGALLALTLSPAVLLGHRLGRRAFERAAGRGRYERLALIVVAAAGVLSLAGALVA